MDSSSESNNNSNRFSLLDMDIDAVDETSSSADVAHQNTTIGNDLATDPQLESNANIKLKSTPKPPQIVVSIGDLNDLFELISEVTNPDSVSVKVSQGETARLFPKDSDTYRAIVNHFDAIGVEFHTYQLKEEKPFRVVVKGLHHSTSSNGIVTEFKKHGFDVLQAHNPKSRNKNVEKLNIFFVNIRPCANIGKIFEIKTLCRQKVRIERMRKSSEIAQCVRCQDYGHTAKYCRRHPNCARCGEDHLTKQCTRSQDEQPTCIHCGGNHRASYKGCQWYQDFLRRSTGFSVQTRQVRNVNNTQVKQRQKQLQQQPTRQQQTQHVRNMSRVVSGGLSYASVARNGNAPAQRRLLEHQAQLKLLPSESTAQQQHSVDVRSLLEQQQQQFLKWQQQLQLQQQQQFLLWLQEQQREQQQQNKVNNQRLERLENMVCDLANMVQQWTGVTPARQLHNNASTSQ